MTVLYSNGCRNCQILKLKLDDSNIPYSLFTDENKMIALGLDEVPILEVDGKRMGFVEAIKYVMMYGGK